jgi:myosin-crossreactive antigen
MMFRFILLVALLCVTLRPSEAAFGFKSKEQKEAEKMAKNSVNAGINALNDVANDPRAAMEAMQMLNDPAARAEVEKMMQDPAFKKEMEKLKHNPQYLQAVENAREMFADPEKAARVQRELMEGEQKLTDAQLGMRELSKAASDPQMLAEAMEMMKDPEIAKEVQEMMKDPAFQAEMRRYTESPEFKHSMNKAAQEIEKIASDPVQMKKAEQAAAAMMGKK